MGKYGEKCGKVYGVSVKVVGKWGKVCWAGVPWWRVGLPSSKKDAFRGGQGANFSSHSKLLVMITQYFHIRVCQTKIRNRDYLEHCSVFTVHAIFYCSVTQ